MFPYFPRIPCRLSKTAHTSWCIFESSAVMKLQCHCEDTGLHHQQISPPSPDLYFPWPFWTCWSVCDWNSQRVKEDLAGSQTACVPGVHTVPVQGLGKYAWLKAGKKMVTVKIKIQMNCDLHMLMKGALRQTAWLCRTVLVRNASNKYHRLAIQLITIQTIFFKMSVLH